ncbi:MAG TPA: RDD family protein [Sphingobium sp.]|uniref:RDD family protein n=1 Tax=Sphingobium sp. TaxID=1912891 RepID=UPI002ED15D0D
MRWPFRRNRARKPPATLRRSFVTPEGVDLRLELASAGGRAAAFLIDALIMLGVLIAGSIAIGLLVFSGVRNEAFQILWLVGFFVLRNGWFILFEMGQRGATPGKRLLGLRVVARDGGRLSGGAVMVRNAMREIEIFLPLSFLGAQAATGAADGFLTLFSLLWSGIFLFFPLFNRDRLRIGDMLAGTWVVNQGRARLGADLSTLVQSERPRRVFSEAALDLYGIYELQTLEDVLRKGQDDVIITVAAAIRRKAAMVDDGDDYGFLYDYYTALCARLERGMMVGRRREDKHSAIAMR